MAKYKKKDLLVFGIAMTVVLAGLGTWQLVKDRKLAGGILLGVSSYFLVGSLFLNALLVPLYGPWMKFGFVLGQIMTRVILGIFFVVAVTPIALIRRVFAKDGLDRKLDADLASYWHVREKGEPEREQYERLF